MLKKKNATDISGGWNGKTGNSWQRNEKKSCIWVVGVRTGYERGYRNTAEVCRDVIRKTKAKPRLARDMKINRKGFCCYVNGKSVKESTCLLAKWFE